MDSQGTTEGDEVNTQAEYSPAPAGIINLAKALLLAQQEIDVAVRDGENPAFKRGNDKSTFATLESVIDAVKPALNKHGIVFIQALTPPPFEGYLALTTTLIHAESGESISGTAVVPLDKATPQGFGSATTYTKRYSLAAFLGLKTEDDDGNAATTFPEKGQQRTQVQPRQRPAPVEDAGTPNQGGFLARKKAAQAAAATPAEEPKAEPPPKKGRTGLFPGVKKGAGKPIDVKADATSPVSEEQQFDEADIPF
jgi:hypothetical protein